MFYDTDEMVEHYKLWFDKYREPIEARLAAAARGDEPQKAIEATAKVILTEILPVAIIEMVLYNNKKLEERFNTDGGGCSGCASNLKG